MVSFTLFKSVSLLAFVSSLVSAAPSNGCSGFHVTAPHSFFTTTAGQCYQVSYDFGGTKPTHPSDITVDLYEYKTNKFVRNVVDGIAADGIATPWFNVDVNKKTGDYYYLVTYGNKCKPIKTPYFHVVYTKHSPPAVCL